MEEHLPKRYDGPTTFSISHEASPDGAGCLIDVIIDTKVGGGIHMAFDHDNTS